MDKIWAPWRKAYIRPKKRKSDRCLFCRLLSENRDAQNLILKRSTYSFAILNLYPYNNGHAMIVPKRHVDSIHALKDHEKLDWLELYEEVRMAMQDTMNAEGFNVGLNLGKIAGAGVPHHLHLHIVPRWSGDVNFMPVLGNTKVISESLESVYGGLARRLKTSGGKNHARKKRS